MRGYRYARRGKKDNQHRGTEGNHRVHSGQGVNDDLAESLLLTALTCKDSNVPSEDDHTY